MNFRACSTAASLAVLCALAAPASAQVGQRFPSERKVINDAVTGVPLTVLTDGKQSDAKLYQTHPQWLGNSDWIVFRTGGRSPGSQAYVVNEKTGEIVQLTAGGGNDTGSLNVARRSMKLYYLRDVEAHARPIEATTRPTTAPTTGPATTQAAERPARTLEMVELDVGKLLLMGGIQRVAAASRDGEIEKLFEPASQFERVIGRLPAGLRTSGGFALDADEKTAYIGVSGGDTGTHLPPGTEIVPTAPGQRMGAGPAGIRAMDLATGDVRVVIDTPFLMGHVQTNPFVPGEIIYAHETAGDAPQRIWTVRADGSGNRLLFKEESLDWVTHETVVTKDEVLFNLIGHQSRLRVRPTGIAVINLRTNAVELLGQVNERQKVGTDDDIRQPQNAAGPDSYGGFWHCNGSADGRWAVGDTFAGNLWLIDRHDGRRTLLTTDHKMKPDHTHPTFSDDGTRILIQSGKWTDGQRLQLVVVPVPQATPADAAP